MTDSRDSDCRFETVWQTVENMRQIGDSIQSLFSVLELELRGVNCFRGVEDITPKNADSWVGSGWCAASEYGVYKLTRKTSRPGRPPVIGAISVRIEIWRDVDDDSSSISEWPYKKTPLIYVGFDPKQDEYWDETCLYLDHQGRPEQNCEGMSICASAEASWLWEWRNADNGGGGAWYERSWFFVVPLFAINNRKDVEVNIVAPVKALLGGTSPCDAFRETKVIPN